MLNSTVGINGLTIQTLGAHALCARTQKWRTLLIWAFRIPVSWKLFSEHYFCYWSEHFLGYDISHWFLFCRQVQMVWSSILVARMNTLIWWKTLTHTWIGRCVVCIMYVLLFYKLSIGCSKYIYIITILFCKLSIRCSKYIFCLFEGRLSGPYAPQKCIWSEPFVPTREEVGSTGALRIQFPQDSVPYAQQEGYAAWVSAVC